MTCEELGQAILCPPMAAHAESNKHAWTEKRRRRRVSPQQRPEPDRQQQQQQQQVISGMLPTLQALATLSCDSDVQRRGVCLVPRESDSDAASHLQQTLLEAYCREIGLRLLRMPETALRKSFGKEHKDLGCLLILDASNFFLESPE